MGYLQHKNNHNIYAGFMQQFSDKNEEFKIKFGKVLRKARMINTGKTLNKFAFEYDIDRGNLSRLERGLVGCSMLTAWRIAEAANIKLSEVVKMLEEELGDDFKLMDE